MRMMDELKHLMLYSANKKVYAPIDEKDKRKNSAILLLTPSLQVSSQLMRLPYIYNPNLFNSFYVDRNVMAYINSVAEDDLDFDEKEEAAISEAMVGNWGGSCKIKFDEKMSMMDKKYIDSVFNKKTIAAIAKKFNLYKVPEKIEIVVHPNVNDLRQSAPKRFINTFEDRLYSYSNGSEVHLLSKFVYDPEYMLGNYEYYLKAELAACMIMLYNQSIHLVAAKGIGMSITGCDTYMRDNDLGISKDCIERKFAYTISRMIENEGMAPIIRYLRTADMRIISRYVTKSTLNTYTRLIFEGELSYFERQRLLPSEFGIPNKRAYPMPDPEHVRAAIRMFNNCDPDDERELADAIIKKMKKFGITDVKVSESNRFSKYYKPAKAVKHEQVFDESFVNTDYGDIMKICSHLSDNEFKRITFYDTYRDSQFVIKRIIHREGLEPAGFLDVYQFPSKPEIAQIVIAVDNRFRNMGIANKMVEELMSSDLHKTHNFSTYWWTAHTNNEASKCLAMKHGFEDTGRLDNYRRQVFIKHMTVTENVWDIIPNHLKPSNHEDFVANEASFITENMAIFYEADDQKYSDKLRRYLYAERLKNNKAVLEIYDQVKASNPDIKKTYLKIKMYKKYNAFVDLSYYHELFLRKNMLKLDKAVNFYFDFLNRLINNPEIDDEYSKKTIFIPIDAGVWPIQPNSEVTDFRKNLNPISIIFRLIRTNPSALKKAWGNKNIIFVGSRGYFTVDFSRFELKDLVRFKNNLKRLMSTTEPIEDEYETDPIAPDNSSRKNTDTKKAMAAKMIDKVEDKTSIKLDDITATNNKGATTVTTDKQMSGHLFIQKDPLGIDISRAKEKQGIVILYADPEGHDGFDKLADGCLANAKDISVYCVPGGITQ